MRKLLLAWRNYHGRMARSVTLRIDPLGVTFLAVGAFLLGWQVAPKVLPPVFKALGF